MRALRVVGVGAVVVLLSGCNCGPMMVADAGMPGVDAGVDAGFDAGVDGGPLRVAYRIGGVTGTYGGDGKNVVSATRTDFLTAVTCTYSGGTDAGLVVGADGGTTMIQVIGAASCPPRMATAVADDGGQAAPPCTTGTFDAPAALFQGTIEQAGWADDAVVTFKIQAPPSGAPGCNNATLVVSAGAPWGIEGSTTAGTFKQLKPFTVKFTGPADGGTKLLTSGANSSNVRWDFSMTVNPYLP